MGKIALYYHGGSKNHGCEAIIRSTAKILGGKITLYSANPEEDLEYGLEKIVDIKSDTACTLNILEKVRAAISYKFFHDDYTYIKLSHKAFFRDVQPGDIYLSVGGDNYCYEGREILAYYNRCIHEKGAKTVLWGCSFEPGDMTNKIAKDIATYDLIIAREIISYEALRKINANTVLLPDPAFQLNCDFLDMSKKYFSNKTVGINLSPLVGNYGNSDLIYENYRNLIQWILDKTEFQVALIPHVVTLGSDDRTILSKLNNDFRKDERVLMISDNNCKKIKEIIAQCDLFVGARTHATIAAYSTCVPTLVVGYSVKSIGIARELFGTEENYVLPVQKLTNKNDLTEAFEWLCENENEIRKHLNDIMPEYKDRVLQAKHMIEGI